MNEIARVFEYQDRPLRTVLVDGKPWFVASDACSLLGFRMASDALRWLENDEKGYAVVRTPGGDQRLSTVDESGLYALIFRSKNESAKKFRRWVTDEVLPAIRESGRYEAPAAAVVEMPNHVEALRGWADALERAEASEAKVLDLAPKAAQADQHRAADGLVAVGDFANKLKAWALREHSARIKHPDVWAFLADIGLIIRGNTVRHNQPTAFAVERDFVRAKETEYLDSDGVAHTSSSPRLTPGGEGWAWDRAVKRIANHGSLEPIRSIERKAS